MIYYKMNFFITFLLFIFILFIYIHINDQYKKSEDLEIYEMDYVSNTKLQEVCNVKQPILFQFSKIYPDVFEHIGELQSKTTENSDVKVKDVLDYWNPERNSSADPSVDPIILPFRSFEGLSKSDPTGHYFMEDNPDFLEDNPDFFDEVRELDSYLKPVFTIHTKYDCLMGSKGAATPLRYHTDYRKFAIVSRGKITVKMTPWKSRKYLHCVKDYDNYEFWSRVNPWVPQKEYINDAEKVKFLEFEVLEGHVLYIPPYWWYSIQFHSCETVLLNVDYLTTMNVCANAYDLSRYYLQFHNTKRKIARTLDIPIMNNSSENI